MEKPLKERILEKVIISDDGCWNWSGAMYKRGYGQIRIGKRCYRAHRISYEVHVGPIPNGMVVMHLCDNKICVRPSHLRVGTQLENMKDGVSKKIFSRDEKWAMEHPEKAKLSFDDVVKIRELYSTKAFSQEKIGKMFGVHQTSIGFIIRRVHWKWL